MCVCLCVMLNKTNKCSSIKCVGVRILWPKCAWEVICEEVVTKSTKGAMGNKSNHGMEWVVCHQVSFGVLEEHPHRNIEPWYGADLAGAAGETKTIKIIYIHIYGGGDVNSEAWMLMTWNLSLTAVGDYVSLKSILINITDCYGPLSSWCWTKETGLLGNDTVEQLSGARSQQPVNEIDWPHPLSGSFQPSIWRA